MVRDNKVYSEAISLRKGGNSYLQISRKLLVPKSTLSGWFSKEKWSSKISSKNSKISSIQNTNTLVLANTARVNYQIKRYKNFKEQATNDFELYKNDQLFVAGVSLYWGEGEKTSSGRVSVINTDPEMIKIMASFYRKYLLFEDSKLRIGLFVYQDHVEAEIKQYWSNLLNIPENQFIKTQFLKSRSKLTSRKSKYGICSLYFSSTEQSVKIREWIRLFPDFLHEH